MSEALHTVEVEVGRYGVTHFRFACSADPASDPPCHMVCPRDSCEEGCHHPDEHVRENAGYCLVTEWLTESDAEECIIGGETTITAPIEFEWHGEGVDWRFASQPAEVTR